MKALELLTGSYSAKAKTYVDDVFSITAYDPKYSSGTISIPTVGVYNTDDWAVSESKQFPGDLESDIDQILSDSSGNMYIMTNRSHISKYSSAGTLLWSKKYPDNGFRNFTVDLSGNIYLAAFKDYGSYNVDSALEVRVLKLDSSGSLLLNKSYRFNGRIYASWVTGMACDSSGNLYMVGPSSMIPTYAGYGSILIKMDSSLNLLWAIGAQSGVSDANGLTNTSQTRKSLVIGASGNVYVQWGYAYDSTQSNLPMYISKVNPSGSILWTRAYGNSNMYTGQMEIDSSENLYICSHTTIFKLNSSGALLEAKGVTIAGTMKGFALDSVGQKLYVGFSDGNGNSAKDYVAELTTSPSIAPTGNCVRIDSNDSTDLTGGSGGMALSLVNGKVILRGTKYSIPLEKQIYLAITLPTSLKVSGTSGLLENAGFKPIICKANLPFTNVGSFSEYTPGTFSTFNSSGTSVTATSYSITSGTDSFTTYNIAGVKNMLEGGMFWMKRRDSAEEHTIVNTFRGISGATAKALQINTNVESTSNNIVSALPSGAVEFQHSFGAPYNNGGKYVCYGFRRAENFFDMVEWTGDGASNRTIPHSLKSKPGIVIMKALSATGDWLVTYPDLGGGYGLKLNSSSDVNSLGNWTGAGGDASQGAHTSSAITVAYATANAPFNTAGVNYIAFLFANDTSADGLIQCGNFNTDGSSNASVSLGWEPQFVMIKKKNSTDHWYMIDTARGMSHKNYRYLAANATAPEGSVTTASGCIPNANGFSMNDNLVQASTAYLFMAIRRSNKPPVSGNQVFSVIKRTGTGASATVTGVGFSPDLGLVKSRANTSGNVPRPFIWTDRLRGNNFNMNSGPNGTNSEANWLNYVFEQDGYSTTATDGEINESSIQYMNYFFKRAAGVFDIVSYLGDGNGQNIKHNLGAVPELMIVKCRGASDSWLVYNAHGGTQKELYLNGTNAYGSSGLYWNSTAPTSSAFSVGFPLSSAAKNYVAYLFATKAGISKVGSYIGNGTTLNIDCGFLGGARFVKIKRTDASGDWFVWDSVRGLIVGNDPYFKINSDSAEDSSNDSLDPFSAGFAVNQLAATNINVSGATYIYLAFS